MIKNHLQELSILGWALGVSEGGVLIRSLMCDDPPYYGWHHSLDRDTALCKNGKNVTQNKKANT